MTRRNKVDAEEEDINVESDMDFKVESRPSSSSGKKKSPVVVPNTRTYELWQDFVIITVVFVVCGEMFLATFDSTPVSLWVLMYLCDVVYLIDMVLMFFTAYKSKDGIWITHRRKIVYHYLAKQFPLDVLSMLPLGLVGLALHTDDLWMNMSFFRLNRVLRVYRVFTFFGHREDDLSRSTTTTRSLKYITISLLTTHFITCGWYRIACDGKHENSNRTCTADSWAIQFDLGFNIVNSDIVDSYVASLYWAVATATSTGYGDIFAKTVPEKWYSIFSMLLGIGVFFGMLLGGMTSLLTNFDAHRANYVHRFQTIKSYLKDLEVDPALIARVNSYYEYLWQQKNGVVGHGIYSKLPVTFQAEISHSTNSDLIENTPIFKDLDPGFLRMLSLNIKQALYLPSQIIQRRGDLGKEMFFIVHGEIEVMSEDDDEVPAASLQSGSVFGEMNLIISLPRTATVRAKTHCDLLIIDKDDLQATLKHFPKVNTQLNDEAKRRFSKIGEILETRRSQRAAKHVKPQALVQPQWLRKASFLPTKEDLSAFSESAVMSMSGSKSKGGLGDVDIEKLRNMHKKGNQRSFSEICHLIFSATIKRSSPFIQGWNYIIVAVTILQAIIQPYMAAFTSYGPRKGYFDTTFGQALLVVSYILDVLLAMDIWIAFRTEVPGQYASINDKKTIAKMYVTGWVFWVDLLSVLPLEILCLLVTGTKDRSRLFGYLRLNRLIKMAKVKAFFGTMEGHLHVTITTIRSLKLVIYICLLSHWAACAMFLMACSGTTCKNPSWISSRNETTLVETAVTEYITSIYWAAATMSSTGYGDISASTTVGRILSLCIMLIGLLLYGYCLALMAATLANADAPRVRFQEKLFAVQKFMKENHLTAHLQHQVIAYMGLIWEKYNGDWMPGQESLIYDAPMVLQKDITYEDACKTVAQVPLFLYTDENFLRSVALKLQTYLFNPGDVVIYCKDVGREMYCIRKGWCRVQTEDGKRLSEIGPGSYIGEVGLLFGDTRSATVVALTHCELVMLTLDDLHEVLISHPIIKDQFEQAERRKATLMDLKDKYTKMMMEDLKLHPASNVDVNKHYSSGQSVTSKKSSTKTFSAATGSTNREYIQPFRNLNPVMRILSKVLMKKTFFNDGPFLRGWVILMVVVAFINCFTATLQAAFMHQSPYMWAFNYLLDIICFVNIYISFHITFYNDKQILVSHPLSTAKHYTITNFVVDLIACFPIEIIAYAAYPHLNYDGLYVLSLVRLNRVLQAYRLPMLFTYLESSVDKETGVLREIKFGFYSLIFLHWLTCTFFILACPSTLLGSYSGYVTLSSGHHCLSTSWLVQSSIDAVSAASTTLYVTCLYWAAATSVSVGYGDISAKTDAEMVVSLIAMVAGVIFFGYIIASVAASLANADAQRARFQEKLSAITNYIKREKVEAPLQKRVLKYYDYVWLRTRGVDPESLFNVLPLSLWGDVTLDLYKSTLEGIELFKGTETSFLKMLSRCIKPILYLKGEYVVKKFDMGSVMFFIQRGAVDVVSEDGKVVFATMRDGNSFGEVALLFSVPRTASIRAGTNADLFCLSKGDLDNVLDLYPKVKETVMDIAEERRQQARKRSIVKANAAKLKSKTSIAKSSKAQVAADSSKTSTEAEAKETESDDDDGPPPEPSEAEIASNMDIQFEGVLPNSDDEEENENSSNNQNNNTSNWNQSNSNKLVDPDYGEFSSLEDWDEIALGNMLSGQAFLNTNRNNPGENTNQNNDKKEEGQTEEETPKRKCNVFHRLLELNRFTIRPSSKWLKMFDSWLCIVGFISVWAITYQATYQDHHLVLVIVNYILDVFFFVKIYLCFHTSFYDHYGDLTDDFEAVYKNYLKRPMGFTLDFVTAFPIDIFALAAPSGDKMMVLSYLRILHCLRIIRVSDFFSNWEKGLNINMLAARLSKFFVILVLLIHFLSCIWYTLACPLAECATSDTWVQNKVGVMDSPMESYCVCYYWTVATMTSTGYGDIYATNVKEMIYAAIVMVVGKLMFGFILGNIASTLSNEEIQKVQYQGQLQVIKETMLSQKVPMDIEDQVVEYMVHLWHRNKGVDRWSLFKDAPDCLQAELYLKIASKMFEAVPLLEGADESFLRSLALSVQQNVYIPGNYIMRKGDVGQEVYYVHKGKVEVWDDDELLQVLKKGEIFGEVSLLCSMARQVTVVARTHVDLLVLSMNDLEEVIHSYPSVGAQIHHAGYQRFKDILPADYARTKFT